MGITERVQQDFRARIVYDEPVERDGMTLIPAARIVGGAVQSPGVALHILGGDLIGVIATQFNESFPGVPKGQTLENRLDFVTLPLLQQQ